jgi:hypothetical protein
VTVADNAAALGRLVDHVPANLIAVTTTPSSAWSRNLETLCRYRFHRQSANDARKRSNVAAAATVGTRTGSMARGSESLVLTLRA